MASEGAIRIEIAETIQTATVAFTPPPVVLSRDILNLFDTGWVSLLRDAEGMIHGWSVTQSGAGLFEEMMNAAEYELFFDVWQWTQYKTGSNAQNSEDQSSAEREAVIEAFKNAQALDPILSRAHPISFPFGSIGTIAVPDFRGQVRVAKGILRVGKIYGCEEA